MLRDGAWHSGVELGDRLGVTRAAISKAVADMPDVPVKKARAGYALPATHRPLDAGRIADVVREQGVALRELVILAEIDSTNRFLLQTADADRVACLAERQSAGRGRRGRSWVADPYSNILLSVSVRLPGAGRALGVLSLAAGVAVHGALESMGIYGASLKWPNDVLHGERKLAGILTEVRGEAEAPRVIIGVGLNCYLSPASAALIDQPWIALQELGGVDRSVLAGQVIARLVQVADAYGRGETQALLAQWRRLHAYAGRAVTLLRDDGETTGTLVDIDEEGALIVRVDGREQTVHSGEARLRPL